MPITCDIFKRILVNYLGSSYDIDLSPQLVFWRKNYILSISNQAREEVKGLLHITVSSISCSKKDNGKKRKSPISSII